MPSGPMAVKYVPSTSYSLTVALNMTALVFYHAISLSVHLRPENSPLSFSLQGGLVFQCCPSVHCIPFRTARFSMAH